MMHEKNQDERWLKPLASLSFVVKTLITRIATPAIALGRIFAFKPNQKIVLGINNLSVIQLSNLWRVVFKSLCLLIDSDNKQSPASFYLGWGFLFYDRLD